MKFYMATKLVLLTLITFAFLFIAYQTQQIHSAMYKSNVIQIIQTEALKDIAKGFNEGFTIEQAPTVYETEEPKDNERSL